jgi:hypothetical protein
MKCRFLIKLFVTLLLALAVVRSCYKESLLEEPESWPIEGRVLEFDHIYTFCDKEAHLLLYPLPADSISAFSPYIGFGQYESVEFNGKPLCENSRNDLGKVRINQPYPVKARVGKHEENYELYFTSLPLIHIHSDAVIQDEPKILSWAELAYIADRDTEPEIRLFESYAGIEIRGRTSAAHEKLSYGLELWENAYGLDRSAPLLDMKEGEDWILDAMFVDPLHMRNKLSFELWQKIWDSKNELHPMKGKPGIKCEFIELFINQQYMGLFCLTERLDEALINLDDGTREAGGVLYKAIDWRGGSTAFSTYNSEPPDSMIWEGWEQIYPDHLANWDPLAELRKSVVLDSDEVFKERISTLLNLEVAADYYLFTNLIFAQDNIIKNYFLTRYANETAFLLLPWDLEGSWGIMWDGGPVSSNELLSNKLYDRLMELDVEGFNDLLEERWEIYRESIFTQELLMAPFAENVGFLKASGAMGRENRRWPGLQISLDQELDYLLDWTTRRLAYLDQIFD